MDRTGQAARIGAMDAQRVKIVEGGKLVIPALMRRELGIVPGDTVMVDIENGELRVRSVAKALERARAILRRHIPEGVSLADELNADRRAEAEHE
jgi:AbrB family looped-hinge helix DNA binding protein